MLGPVKGVQGAPHTAQLSVAGGLSVSTDFFAISKISGEMIGSAIGFFFIPAFTIEQIGGQVSLGTYKPSIRSPNFYTAQLKMM